MKIFLTDDNPIQRHLIRDCLLSDEREIREFNNGQELLAAINDEPDLILLDIEMPDMDGLETCRRWRTEESGNCLIVFISSHNSLDKRLAAYDAGGNDYIIKPVTAEELKLKIETIEAQLKQKQALAEQAQSATQMAFTALSTIGEMGITQQFMQASFNASTMEDLIRAVTDALHGYDLKGLIEIRLGGITRHFSSEANEVTQMEQSLLKHAADMGRIFQLSDRMVINYPTITVLMSRLPVSEPEKVGRLRDHLAILVEGANTRLKALEVEQINNAKTLGISRVLAHMSDVLDQIQCNQASIQLRTSEINDKLYSQLIEAFVPLGLSDYQENNLINIAKRAHNELETLRSVDEPIQEQLYLVTHELNKLMGIE